MHERDNILEAWQPVFSDGRMLMSFPRPELAGQTTAQSSSGNLGISFRDVSLIKLRFSNWQCFGNPNKADALGRYS